MNDDIDPGLPEPVIFHVGMRVRVKVHAYTDLLAACVDLFGLEGTLDKMDLNLNYSEMRAGAERRLIPVGMVGGLIVLLDELERA